MCQDLPEGWGRVLTGSIRLRPLRGQALDCGSLHVAEHCEELPWLPKPKTEKFQPLAWEKEARCTLGQEQEKSPIKIATPSKLEFTTLTVKEPPDEKRTGKLVPVTPGGHLAAVNVKALAGGQHTRGVCSSDEEMLMKKLWSPRKTNRHEGMSASSTN